MSEKLLDSKKIMTLARQAISYERIATQNAEYGRDRVVEKYQRLSEEVMQQLADYLGEPRYPIQGSF